MYLLLTNMETFKLDLSKLTPVAEDDRVKGNWYVVADEMDNESPIITQFYSGNNGMMYGEKSVTWNYWFAIPPGLPGFPQAELPDEFELKRGEREYIETKTGWMVRKVIPKLPQLSIPSGTKSEQVAELKRLLEELEK